MAVLSFLEARACVEREVRAALRPLSTETVDLLDSVGRILAEEVRADRDYPALARSVRDGFAIRAADVPGELHIAGEVRAGEQYTGAELPPHSAIEIMTGAPLPAGADAVIMVEHVIREGDRIRYDRTAKPGDFINPQGGESRAGTLLFAPGVRIEPFHIAVFASVGLPRLRVYSRPTVAILATGDEVIPLEKTPAPYQVRNSNASSVAALVSQFGGEPWVLPVAPDRYQETRDLIEQGVRSDLLLLSGGVSAGKYDIVEKVLADLGAHFYFDRVTIQPGQPLVFGRVRNIFCFGLPGNPVSSMITFRLFGSLALQLLAGAATVDLPLLSAPLTRDAKFRRGLTRFLPAMLDQEHRLTPVSTQGSSDSIAAARANCFLVTDPDREHYAAGELIRVLLK